MKFALRLAQRFRRYPFWSQVLITLASLVVLVGVWSACGIGVRSRPAPLAQPRAELLAVNGTVFALAFHPSGKWLAAGTSDQMARIWDLSKSEVIHTMAGHKLTVTCLAYSPDGALLATGSADKTVKLWDVSSGNEVRTLAGHAASVRGVAFSPDGRWLASGSDDKTIRIWNISTGDVLRTLEGHTAGVNAIALSPDGHLLASASEDKTIRLWDPETGKLLRTLLGHDSRVLSIAFSPDGKLLASGGAAQYELLPAKRTAQVRLWNPLSGKEEHAFIAIKGEVRSLAFSPDGRLLSNSDSFSHYGRITSWDVQSRTVWSQWYAHPMFVTVLAYSPDGVWLASGGLDGRIRLWQVHRPGNGLEISSGAHSTNNDAGAESRNPTGEFR